MPLLLRWPRMALVGCIAAAAAWRVAAQVDLAPLVALEMRIGRPWGWPEDVVRYLLAHQLPAYIGHFALGILLGRAWLHRELRRIPALALDASAAAAIVALDLYLAAGRSVVGELAWLVPMLALAVLLCAAAHAPAWTSRLLARGPLAFVGRVSYSMYLYHLPLLLLLAPALPAQSLFALPAYLAAAIAVGWVSWRYVERPWLRGIARRTPLAARAPAHDERGADGEDLQRRHAPEDLREAPRIHERAES
jgi:peptidoglycan/LPS O-acetylase OafA/YrhL